jgi:23S rRNA pseudouridine1911/1915/1917 synthase
MPKIETLFEDENILAINKPAGLVVHADGKTSEPTVAEWFVNKYPEAREVGESIQLSSGRVIERPGIVHRLDRETSGVLLLAKTAKGFECLKEQFQSHEIEKKYHAFLYGNLKEDHGTISLSISRSKSDFRKRIAGKPGRGEAREAITYYQVLKRTSEVTFVEAKPKTGRTHQIRVHFRALHCPVVADSLYAAGKPSILGFNRLALHARQIIFKDTKDSSHIVEAPYPEDFLRAIEQIK